MRYRGTHIKRVVETAKNAGKPLFFLSGLHGFIPANFLIENYEEITIDAELSKLVTSQLQEQGITVVEFYIKPSDQWRPYFDLMVGVTKSLGIDLRIKDLPSSA